MTILVEKIRIPLLSWQKPEFFRFLDSSNLSRASILLLSAFIVLFLWYLGEVYYTFNLGYQIRAKEASFKIIEVEYERNQALLVKMNSASSLLGTETAKSMPEISSLKYLQSKNYFVELHKNIP